ncbi:MAG: hypothetical protein IJK38_01635, partial [Oscillospiraceae bacterium]|nr:hypothetical protein [Oscillospiraceae bacterium]
MKPHYISLKDSPSPKSEYVQEFGNLTGGLNLRDADYRLKANESPEMKNLLWRDGMLRSRKGQRWLSSAALGTGYAAFEKLWHGYAFCHIGSSLYCYPCIDGSGSVVGNSGAIQLCTGVPEVRGTFFLYGNQLYYKTRGAYIVITAEAANDGWSFTAASVNPYVPVVLINADPTSATGDLYQPENRLQPRKTVWYNATSGVKQYHLPVLATNVTRVEVDGVRLT